MSHAPNDPATAIGDARSGSVPLLSSFLRGATGGGPTKIQWAVLVVLGWTAEGLIQVGPDLLKGIHWYEFLGKLLEAWSWVPLTPIIVAIDRKLSAGQASVTRLCLIHLLLSIPFSVIRTYVCGLLFYPFPEIGWSPLRTSLYLTYYLWGSWMMYCAFVCAVQAFKFYNGLLTSQLELERVKRGYIESRLNALRLQLEPHFLFNALNAISSEVVENPELVQDMIESLGALLRRSMDHHGSTEITLAQELTLLDHYLAIQKLRFGDRVDIRIEVEPAALSALVPSMMFQPLVENAIRHGLERRISGGMVAISAKAAGDELRVHVTDDGMGLPADWRMETCSGLGLRVTRERLEALYSHADDRFAISPRPGGGVEVSIRIPFNASGAGTDGLAA
jgi:two-component sensor histidine kinase